MENAPEEDYIRTRGRHGHNDSKYYGALFNLFGSRGCFDHILTRLNVREGGNQNNQDNQDNQDNQESKGKESKGGGNTGPPRLSMNELSHLVKILTRPCKWYVPKFQEQFFPQFQTSVFNRLSQLSNHELQQLDQAKLQDILSLVEKLLLETIDNFSGDEMLERFQLQLSRTLLTCPYLNKRLLGVELIIEWIQRAERKDNRRRDNNDDDGDDDDGRGRYGGECYDCFVFATVLPIVLLYLKHM